MGILDFIRGELIEIIEWTDSSRDTLVYRFPVKDHQIKYGAQLTVREGQSAILINEGQLADVFEPGRHELETKNVPVLSRLQGWKHGFESPFKAEVYFVNTRQFTDQKWGTQNPIMMRDLEFGPVRVRAFGTYSYRVTDPGKFLQEIVGTDGHFVTEDISRQLRAHVVTAFTDALGEAKIPVLDLASSYKELGGRIGDGMQDEMGAYGLGLTTFLIENISLPKAVEEALDKRTSMGVLGDLNKYTQFQAANAMEAAAANPGGGAGDAMGMGAGLAMGQAMMNAMSQPQAPAAPAAPAADDLATRLGKLKTLLENDLISQEDFDAKKAEILSQI